MKFKNVQNNYTENVSSPLSWLWVLLLGPIYWAVRGGPIVDDTGELIGIAVAGLAKDKSEGINFGIKSLSAVAFLKTNNIDPETSIMTFGMNNKKLLQLLEESTVYTYCN